MVICPSCGTENTDAQKFCGECATPLGAAPVRSEERKVVTSLFCDLVGFTATSESADPEDVDQMLTAYAEMARAQIESHGGMVEKFIGDAVVGIFGVPAAHEDDPERAVRAGIRIVEGAEDLEAVGGAPLRLRVGINTGEALVRLGVIAGSGERVLSGDAINTASRLQSVAPEMGVAVGLATYEATAAVFDYEELEPATLKGKAELGMNPPDQRRDRDVRTQGRQVKARTLKTPVALAELRVKPQPQGEPMSKIEAEPQPAPTKRQLPGNSAVRDEQLILTGRSRLRLPVSAQSGARLPASTQSPPLFSLDQRRGARNQSGDLQKEA